MTTRDRYPSARFLLECLYAPILKWYLEVGRIFLTYGDTAVNYYFPADLAHKHRHRGKEHDALGIYRTDYSQANSTKSGYRLLQVVYCEHGIERQLGN